MAHQTMTQTHVTHHPLGRAAGIDAGIVAFGFAAIALTFLTGQGVADWQNIVFAPLAFLLAAVTMWLVVQEIRTFASSAGDSPHKGVASAEVVVALIALVVVGPVLLVMPWAFVSAVF